MLPQQTRLMQTPKYYTSCNVIGGTRLCTIRNLLHQILFISDTLTFMVEGLLHSIRTITMELRFVAFLHAGATVTIVPKLKEKRTAYATAR